MRGESALPLSLGEGWAGSCNLDRSALAPNGAGERRQVLIAAGCLAERLPEPRRSQLITVAAGLKKQLASMEQLRLTGAMVTQQVLKHLDEVVSVMTAGAPGGDLYGRTGVRQESSAARVFEAVG